MLTRKWLSQTFHLNMQEIMTKKKKMKNKKKTSIIQHTHTRGPYMHCLEVAVNRVHLNVRRRRRETSYIHIYVCVCLMCVCVC